MARENSNYYTSAGNFIGAIQGSVDSRTGIFNVNLPLGKIIGNNLMGPSLSLNLLYSPLSSVNIGFGRGFQLNLSTFNLNTRKLMLSTGEEYRITQGGDVKQQKLKTVVFKRINDSTYKIIHKSGVIEKLILGSEDFYVPSEITSADGRKLHLTWSSPYPPAKLTEIKDDTGLVLCTISYPKNDNNVTCFTYLPGDTFYQHKINFNFINDLLTKMISDGTDQLIWSFEYDNVGPRESYRAIVGVKSPTGLEERVSYYSTVNDSMEFPEKAGNMLALPCVYKHELLIGGGQPKCTTIWSYTKNNYLGHGANFNSWHPDEDQMLSILLRDYEYGSTATQLDANGKTLCQQIRRYNSYHLLTSQTVVRGGKKHTKQTEYYAEINKTFDDQPKQYSLPKKTIEKWHDNETDFRTETTEYEFDKHGNPTRQLTSDGTVIEYTYYTDDSENCPEDFYKFVRYPKSQTVIPPKISQTETTKTSIHTYIKVNALNDEGYAVVLKSTQETIGKSVSLTTNTYNMDRSNASFYGRLIKSEITLTPDSSHLAQFTSTGELRYFITNSECTERHEFIGHDGLRECSEVVRDIRTGKTLLETSTDGVQTVYKYDVLGRILCRTRCLATEYENITEWEYSINENGCCTIQTGAKGNKIKNSFDGLGRLHTKQVFEAETSEWYDVYSCTYNELGEVITGITKDHSKESFVSFPLKCDIDYDGWGAQCSASFDSVGRKEMHQTDLVNLKFTTYRAAVADNETLTTAREITTLDERSKLPINKVIRNVAGEEYSTHSFTWNGIGQLWKDKDVLGHVTERTYDDYGRILTQKYADDTIVSNTYVPHLTGNYVTSISITGLNADGNIHTWLMGTQTFDSLGRLMARNVCGRETLYEYEGSSSVPSQVTLPSGKLVKYTYIPELGNVINSFTVDNVTQTYTYDNLTGMLLTAHGSNSQITNSWSTAGLLNEEIFTCDGKTRLAKHTNSLNGAPMMYTDVAGKQTRYGLDAHGRILSIVDDNVTVHLTYDHLGYLVTQTVHDVVADSSLITALQYDDFGREITRTVRDSNGKTIKLLQTWQKNNVLEMRTTQVNGVQIRSEQFIYDKRNRLIKLSASGNPLPCDAYGNQMIEQTYNYDALNNITSVSTILSDNSTNKTTYRYENNNDPTQLTTVTHSHPKYPASFQLNYDTDGRMIRDEAGRKLSYDAMGRLINIESAKGEKGAYSYDALNRLIKQNVGDDNVSRLYYRGFELLNEANEQTSKQHEIRYLKLGHNCIAVNDNKDITLTASDKNDSLLWSRGGNQVDGQLYNWSPYGNGQPSESITQSMPLGFNGERIDCVSGSYHLGNGYRAYNPVLMRFNCPDSLSPFGAGGINPYAYCSGDPINHTDPSGHLSWSGIFGIIAGAVGLALAVFTAGTSIAAAGGVMAAFEAASMSSLALGGVDIASDLTSIASGALEDASPEASSILGWASLATGIPGIFLRFDYQMLNKLMK